MLLDYLVLSAYFIYLTSLISQFYHFPLSSLQVAYVVHDPEYPAPQDILDMAEREADFTTNYLKEHGGCG
jgi:hypothetical protein